MGGDGFLPWAYYKKKNKRNYTNLYIFLFIVLVGFLAYQVYLRVDFNELFKKEKIRKKQIKR